MSSYDDNDCEDASAAIDDDDAGLFASSGGGGGGDDDDDDAHEHVTCDTRDDPRGNDSDTDGEIASRAARRANNRRC